MERVCGVEGFILLVGVEAFEVGVREDVSRREVDDEEGEDGEEGEELRRRGERPRRLRHGGDSDRGG